MQPPSQFFPILRTPYVHGAVGLLMAAAGMVEAIQPFLDDIKGNEMDVGAHHGVLLYGVYIFLRSFGESVNGLKDAREGLEAATAAVGAGHGEPK